ncbi:MAG: hypothetical protein KGL48_16260 [Sphingomonadales bacterium]|nr:hypothetical protein [Sphingomonadales bacterium]MDE2568060.1 hypothetical protein [Sphingomonadales bacterium]
MASDSSDHHFSLAVSLSVEALKALLWFNGGAATALIALTSKKPGSVDYGRAVLIFGLGVLLTVVAMAFGYFSQLSYANHRLADEQQKTATAKREYAHHRFWQTAALIAVALSLAASAVGMATAFYAIEVS